jgi:tetratricopeptide (TPR) repeat protein
MIVKDEEAMLPRCLAAVADHVDEIVVVDTGSTDGTVAIAESFGARVLHHPWTGDFSEARNVGLDAAKGDWLMFLDADEVLVTEDGPRLREALGQTWREAFYISETNHMGHEEDGSAIDHQAMRLWRNRPAYRFEGRVHEHFSESLPMIGERIGTLAVRVDHYGYLTAVRSAKDKTQRNLQLLQRQAAEGNDSPFLHFNLGTEYSVAGDQALALRHMERAWEQLSEEPGRGARRGYFPTLANRYIRLLMTNGRVQDGLRVGDEVLDLLPAFTDVVYSQAFAHRHLGDRAAAIAAAQRCLEMGDAPAAYVATKGSGTFLARILLAELLVQEGRGDEAEEHLHRVVVDHPGFIGGVEPYAKALLRRGMPAADVAQRLHGLVPDMTPGQRFLLAVPFYEAGAVVPAEAELRAILEAQPGAHAARLALAEALLSQNRLDEAATTAMDVPAEAPHASPAATTALFARLAGGAPADQLDAAWAYAGAAGLGADQLALLRAWRAGAAAPASIPGTAGPVAAVMLEALARLEDFDGFERLASAAEGLDLPWRERRELLAGVYLRRGFLDSAAAEWIGVVEREGPDERALLGMALVADARGLSEDAEVFRAEARELEAAKA